MYIPFTSTLDALLGLQEAMENSRNTGFFGSGTSARGVIPQINIFEKGGDLMLVTELPGFEKDAIRIEVQDDQLRLAGERRIAYSEGASLHRSERKAMKFDRTVKLPIQVEVDKIQADYQDGLLTIQLPRAEADKPRAIQIA